MFKKVYLIILFLVLNFTYSQDFKNEWKKVYQYELDGKIESAQKEVESIYKKAKRKKNDVTIVKCFFYLSKFEQVFDENAQSTIISNLRKEIKEASKKNEALLNYIYSEILDKYRNQYRYAIGRRTTIENNKNKDFLTWTNNDFDKEIEKCYQEILKNKQELRAISLENYKEIIDYNADVDAKNNTLYDFLYEKSIQYFAQNVYWDRNSKEIKLENLFILKPETFFNQKLSENYNKNAKTFIEILQENERFLFKTNQLEKLDKAYYYRLNYIFNKVYNHTTYRKKLSELEKSTDSEFLKQQLKLERVQVLFNKQNDSLQINYKKQALDLIDSIFMSKVNINVLSSAENIRNTILQKTLNVQFLKEVYANQNNRAFIDYKNVDSIKISYFKFPIALNDYINNRYYNYSNKRIDRDSLVFDFINKNKAYKSFIRKLPKKTDYNNHSTEVILEPFDVGNYLIFMETPKDSIDNAFHYELIKSTNFIVTESQDDKNDILYLYDSKSGKPIENAKVSNDKKNFISDKNGKVLIDKMKYDSSKVYDNFLFITKENDTLKRNYNRSYIYEKTTNTKEKEYKNFEAKAMVFFDRAIYRPGQKMYYKGVMVQKKDNNKSVVPFLSIHVSINDVNDNILKEFEVQTNEFGSFSGEFEIPKNVLTGQFSMSIEEADDYEVDDTYYDKKEDEHSFWDNVNFNNYTEFTFQVEEYKRPTFEVNFEEIKENYTIGDSLQINGNAKALAGNNITNAKVAYTITRDYETVNQDWDYKTTLLEEEILTDSKGNFTIPIHAVIDSVSIDSIQNISYTINVTITDTNGETRTASKQVFVNQKTLKLSIEANNIVYVEDKNTLKIHSTTYNNFSIDAKGEIKIYKLIQKQYLIDRAFQVPEIQTIPREEFEALFPHEPYDNSDYKVEKKLVKTLNFDTKINREINLDFLNEFNANEFEITISAKDSKNNLIEATRKIKTESRKNPISKTELFTYKDISKTESNYFEIEVQSIIPNLYVTQRYYADKTTPQQEKTQQLVNGKTVFSIKKEKEYTDTVNFHFSTIWENKYLEKTYAIEKEKATYNLNIEINSIRNKIEPGSNESWSFKIQNSKLEAEVLASMYDSSLDQFTIQNWTNAYFYEYRNYFNAPRLGYRDLKTYADFNGFHIQKNFYSDYSSKPEINWFGFNFNDPKNQYVLKNYLYKIKTQETIPNNAKTITGVVSDELGTLAGASVVVKGTTRGAVTNFDGIFEIRVKTGEVLEISFPGKKISTITIGTVRNYDISLQEGFVGDEIVIAGALGIKRKSDEVTSSYQVVNDEANDFNYYKGNIYQKTNENVVQALAGKVSGLQINSTTNKFNPTNSIVLRGNRSVTGNNEALIVIDGEISTAKNLQGLDPSSILEITVIRGAEGAALYGEKGKNGVIVVTTKNAMKDLAQVKTRTNFNETAFFYPNLKTDKNGKISFEFITPESLTKWKLRLFAHNKNVETGYFQADIISQKDVMIQTYMPRFVREKDEIKISAKVVNMTSEIKTGIAMLQLFDATTNTLIDEICANKNNVRNFSCKAKESVPVEWTIKIPEGLQGLQYKIVAKSGNFSDGEEIILPVLSNKVLLTESIPIWVKGETKKQYEFPNLKNNTSTTLKNHLFTLEYTSNPTWLALQSLPYLMEYEHECAEETFSRYYANYIATQIIDSNPKIAALFESWKREGKSTSKLNMNEELKSIVLAETPWLLDAQNEEFKNKRLALLMDLNSMKESMESTLKKLKEKQKASGSFSWFDGGDDNVYITQHIVKGLGHLAKLFPEKDSIYTSISDKAIPFLDQNYISNSTLKNKRINYYTYSNLHYLYARSFYAKKYPVSKKIDSIITIQKIEFKKDWLTYTLYSKALLALTMNRFGDKAFAKKILTNLKETAARNEDNGMYWVENSNGYYWYQNAIETQAILIEAFAEIENDDKILDELKVWLLKNKQVNKWSTTKSTTEAVYALLLQGSDWISIKDNTKFTIGNEKIFTKKLSEKDKEAETGYIKLNWKADEITKEMGTVKVENRSKVPGYGGFYWQYFENLENIKTDSTKALNITKTLYKKVKTTKGNELIDLNKEDLKTGDLITIRLVIKTENELEFVHLKDLRASCFEPVDVISNYEWRDNLSYYRSTKDVATHYFFDKINKGTYVLEYDVRINNSGNFNDGIATLQSMYAPEFSTHSTNTTIKVD
jgi:uncharacterized protein YfaS (alpha-2-macroglobulin family)